MTSVSFGPSRIDVAEVCRWLGVNQYGKYLAGSFPTYLSVDFPRGTQGSCKADCPYCYAAKSRHASTRPVELQWQRFRQYLESPEKYASKVHLVLRRFHEAFGLPIGSERFPLRLFSCGDVKDPKVFAAFHRELTERRGVHVFGFSRYLGLPRCLWFSADAKTPVSDIAKAKNSDGRKVAYVRFPGEDKVPTGVDLIFPSHEHRFQVPRTDLDCLKLRHDHDAGVCMSCRRCFGVARTQKSLAA